MAYLRTGVMKARGRRVIEHRTRKAVLAEATRFDPNTTYDDVFLSHSSDARSWFSA